MTALFLSVSAAAAILQSPAAAGAAPRAPRDLESAGWYLAERQGASAKGDGALLRAGWSWLAARPAAAANTSGTVALALLEAARATGEPAFAEAAMARAEVVRLALRGGEEPFAPDIELLARTGDAADRDAARLFVEARIERAGGAVGEVRRLARLRAALPDLVAYDAALLADAAFASGLGAQASALVSAATRAWPKTPDSSHGVVSLGALLAAAALAGSDAAARCAVALASTQGRDGSWAVRDTQATAFATRGLALHARATGDRDAARAAARGAAWLHRTQLAQGAWASWNDGLPEPFVGALYVPQTAEAVRALALVR